MEIIDRIGEPAALEQLAEECAECAKAALKLARILRCENPTPVTERDARKELTEEIQDVNTCVYVIGKMCGVNWSKLNRWNDRLDKAKKEAQA